MIVSRHSSGFTLVEVLTVVLLIGILTCSGTAFYAGLTRETSERTQLSSLQAFLDACRGRARLRGTPVELRLMQSTLFAADSPALSLRLSNSITEQARTSLSRLVFIGSNTLLASQPVQRLGISFEGAASTAFLMLGQ
ncbi:MAG: prepilin-type N-terminal cleavage/methylation domain-containing protein [Candidatus Ozemobacteraceae bacterium]